MILEFLLIPLIAAFITPFFRPKAATGISTVAFLIPFGFTLYGLATNMVVEEKLIDIVKPIGTFYLLGDQIAFAFGLAVCIVSAMVALYSLPYMVHRFEEMNYDVEQEFRKYIFLYNLYAASMLWLVFSGNFILLYIFLEVSLLASFLLIYMYGYGNRRWVATLYFIWTHIAGMLALIGFLMTAFDNQSLAFNEIARIGFVAWLLIFLGMIIKLPGLGPHIWLPWAHAEAPTPVSALLSPLTVGLGAYVILRVYMIDPWFVKEYTVPIFIYGVVSSIYAGFAVFKQNDYKRLLAYSTVSQMGYCLIALCLGTYGIMGIIIQYISHAFGKAILFMTAGGIIALYHGLRDITKMGGMHEYVPTISNAALIGFMNLSGVLAVGMFGEFFILKGIVDTMGFNIPAIISVIVVFIISGLYSFYTLRRIYYGTPRGYEKARVPRLLDMPLYVIGVISVIFIFPPLAPLLLNALKVGLGGVVP
ncbi:complex I subunit 5 family protein [Archaeoglobus veneficus]|uniref:NADH dehydrogenase (Quinone) n=1 Tax=Archaeoglobus veneficus (strain DSM 11195 / SNP6) TaxID=693661 RepID=F2KQB6_ARCVS|nr:complex I subunit 5 family protein [Archaeoglobus veneficus]AEA46549.1 NADH dehydrogenase (quinone) [Archaeoglobus veneficus SNP6]